MRGAEFFLEAEVTAIEAPSQEPIDAVDQDPGKEVRKVGGVIDPDFCRAALWISLPGVAK
jgi:hypothetical protein